LNRPGYFRAAHLGTLFLDELGELPLLPQAKLLRAIDRQEIQLVGEQQTIPCDVRIVAATLRELTTDVREGRFRKDLYARLSFTVLRIPPLRERREDLLLLLRHTLRSAKDGLRALDPELVELLLLHPWPYNVRELQQIAHHLQQYGADDALYARLRENAALSAPAKAPEPTAAQSQSPPAEPAGRTRPRQAPVPTAAELRALLTVHRGTVRHIAQALGCSRRHVGRLIEEHGIDLSEYRTGGADSDEE
jgi:DNA-binding NtrC family response regulator